MSDKTGVRLAIRSECDRRIHIFFCANCVQNTFKLHKHDNRLGKTFRVRPAEPRVDTWWFTCLAAVSIYPYGNSEGSLIARRELMTHNTLFDRRFYRAERILAVRTAIRASRGAVWARLEPRHKQLLFWPPRPNQLQSPFRLTLSAHQKFFVRVRAAAAMFRGPFTYLFPIFFLIMTSSAFLALLLKNFSAHRSRYVTQHGWFWRSQASCFYLYRKSDTPMKMTMQQWWNDRR